MKEICVDLELAKKLKENGFKQDSYFYKVKCRARGLKDNSKNPITVKTVNKNELDGLKTNIFVEVVSICNSFTAEELLKELPSVIKSKYGQENLNVFPLDKYFEVNYRGVEINKNHDTILTPKVAIS
jgi:hypothetical protein